MADSKEELKSLLMKVKEESEKAGLKNEDHGIWSHHLWQIDGETMETVRDFILVEGLQNHCNDDCCHEI